MFFSKKEADKIAAKNFWLWFAEHEAMITEAIENHSTDIAWTVDAELKPVFPYFKKELEFSLSAGEITFFHMGNKNLRRDAEMLKAMIPTALAERWTFVIEK